MARPGLLLLLSAATALALPFQAPSPAPHEVDSEESRQVLGSSVVTSVSVIMDLGNGTKAYFADGRPVEKPTVAAMVGSPGGLLSPDRYEFYTFDESGELVKRFMTLNEIQSIIAGGDGKPGVADKLQRLPAVQDHEASPSTVMGVRDVVASVQNVLKGELEANKNKVPTPIASPPSAPVSSDVSSDSAASWGVILPAIMGATSDEATEVTLVTVEDTRKPSTTKPPSGFPSSKPDHPIIHGVNLSTDSTEHLEKPQCENDETIQDHPTLKPVPVIQQILDSQEHGITSHDNTLNSSQQEYSSSSQPSDNSSAVTSEDKYNTVEIITETSISASYSSSESQGHGPNVKVPHPISTQEQSPATPSLATNLSSINDTKYQFMTTITREPSPQVYSGEQLSSEHTSASSHESQTSSYHQSLSDETSAAASEESLTSLSHQQSSEEFSQESQTSSSQHQSSESSQEDTTDSYQKKPVVTDEQSGITVSQASYPTSSSHQTSSDDTSTAASSQESQTINSSQQQFSEEVSTAASHKPQTSPPQQPSGVGIFTISSQKPQTTSSFQPPSGETYTVSSYEPHTSSSQKPPSDGPPAAASYQESQTVNSPQQGSSGIYHEGTTYSPQKQPAVADEQSGTTVSQVSQPTSSSQQPSSEEYAVSIFTESSSTHPSQQQLSDDTSSTTSHDYDDYVSSSSEKLGSEELSSTAYYDYEITSSQLPWSVDSSSAANSQQPWSDEFSSTASYDHQTSSSQKQSSKESSESQTNISFSQPPSEQSSVSETSSYHQPCSEQTSESQTSSSYEPCSEQSSASQTISSSQSPSIEAPSGLQPPSVPQKLPIEVSSESQIVSSSKKPSIEQPSELQTASSFHKPSSIESSELQTAISSHKPSIEESSALETEIPSHKPPSEESSELQTESPSLKPPSEESSELQTKLSSHKPPSEESSELQTEIPSYKPPSEESSELQTEIPSHKPPSEESSELQTEIPSHKPTSEESSELQTEIPSYKPPSEESSELQTEIPSHKPPSEESSELQTESPSLKSPSEESSELQTKLSSHKPPSEESSELQTEIPSYKPPSEESSELQTEIPSHKPPSEESSELQTEIPSHKPTSEESSELQTEIPSYKPPSEESSELQTEIPSHKPPSEESSELQTEIPSHKPSSEDSPELQVASSYHKPPSEVSSEPQPPSSSPQPSSEESTETQTANLSEENTSTFSMPEVTLAPDSQESLKTISSAKDPSTTTFKQPDATLSPGLVPPFVELIPEQPSNTVSSDEPAIIDLLSNSPNLAEDSDESKEPSDIETTYAPLPDSTLLQELPLTTPTPLKNEHSPDWTDKYPTTIMPQEDKDNGVSSNTERNVPGQQLSIEPASEPVGSVDTVPEEPSSESSSEPPDSSYSNSQKVNVFKTPEKVDIPTDTPTTLTESPVENEHVPSEQLPNSDFAKPTSTKAPIILHGVADYSVNSNESSYSSTDLSSSWTEFDSIEDNDSSSSTKKVAGTFPLKHSLLNVHQYVPSIVNLTPELADSLTSVLSQVVDQATLLEDVPISNPPQKNETQDPGTTVTLDNSQSSETFPSTSGTQDNTESYAFSTAIPLHEPSGIISSELTFNSLLQPVTINDATTVSDEESAATTENIDTTIADTPIPVQHDNISIIKDQEDKKNVQEIEKDIQKEVLGSEKQEDGLVKRQDEKLGETLPNNIENEETDSPANNDDLAITTPTTTTAHKVYITNSPIVYEDADTFNSYTSSSSERVSTTEKAPMMTKKVVSSSALKHTESVKDLLGELYIGNDKEGTDIVNDSHGDVETIVQKGNTIESKPNSNQDDVDDSNIESDESANDPNAITNTDAPEVPVFPDVTEIVTLIKEYISDTNALSQKTRPSETLLPTTINDFTETVTGANYNSAPQNTELTVTDNIIMIPITNSATERYDEESDSTEGHVSENTTILDIIEPVTDENASATEAQPDVDSATVTQAEATLPDVTSSDAITSNTDTPPKTAADVIIEATTYYPKNKVVSSTQSTRVDEDNVGKDPVTSGHNVTNSSEAVNGSIIMKNAMPTVVSEEHKNDWKNNSESMDVTAPETEETATTEKMGSSTGLKDSPHDLRPLQPITRPQYETHFQAMSTPIDLDPAPTENLGLEVTTANLSNDIRKFADLCNELAFRLWSVVAIRSLSSARSLVMSPIGLTSILAMVFLGARGPTSGQMNDILGLDDMVTFNPHQVFRNVTESVVLSKYPGVATAAFVRELYSDRTKGKLLDFYKERAQQFYDGHVEEVNFNMINDVLRRRTNLLVKRQTWGKIPEYLRGSNIQLHPPLAAFSANIFQTDCSQASTEGRNGEMYFTVLPSTRQRRLVPVPAAVWRSGFLAGYEPNLDATAVALGGADGSLVSVILILPGQQGQLAQGDSLALLEKRLIEPSFRRGAWSRVLRSLLPRPGLEVQLPRFSHRSLLNMTGALLRMGLKDLFSAERADLSGLNGVANDLHLSDIVQVNTFSTCAEDSIGTRHHIEVYPSSAQQGRSGRDGGSLDFSDVPLALRPRQARVPDAPRLRFDRPFLYVVRHNPTGFLLHIGRFNPHLLH